MVHSSELRLSLLTLRLLLGGPQGVKARVSAGVEITEEVVKTIKNLQASIRNYRQERFAVLKDYLTEEFYQEFTREASIWCLDPNWDSRAALGIHPCRPQSRLWVWATVCCSQLPDPRK